MEGCELCSEISNKECDAFVQVVQGGIGLETGDYVLLKGPEPPNPFVEGVVGVSVYSGKFDVAGVGVFPVGEEIR